MLGAALGPPRTRPTQPRPSAARRPAGISPACARAMRRRRRNGPRRPSIRAWPGPNGRQCPPRPRPASNGPPPMPDRRSWPPMWPRPRSSRWARRCSSTRACRARTGVLCVLPCARARLHRRQAAGGGRGRAHGTAALTPLYAAPFAPRLFWDGRAATLKEQVMGPLHDPREMNHDAAGAVARLDASESLSRPVPARIWRSARTGFASRRRPHVVRAKPATRCHLRGARAGLSDRCRPAGARAGRLRRHPAP